MHFVFLTMEATNNSTLKAAADELNRKFHIGLEVLPPVNPEYYWHNRNEFEKKVFPALRDRIDARRYPHYLQPLWKRMLKYGLNPAFRFHIAAEMEGQDLKRRWIFYLQELRFSLLEKLK